jgi:hypothetical protein
LHHLFVPGKIIDFLKSISWEGLKMKASFGLGRLHIISNFDSLTIKKMNKFKIVPLSKSFAENIKRTMRDDFGHPVTEQIATGAGPCRVSLKPFKKAVDKRLLLTHSPFAIDNAYNQPGPIFINSADVEEYNDIYRFPPEIKANKNSFPLTLIGYNTDQQMACTRLVCDADIDELIVELFETRPEVKYLHVRNAQACCFICKVERLNERESQ